MRFSLDVFGDVQFARDLLRFGDRAMDMRPAFDEIHRSFLAIERRQFESEGQFSGSWAPLKEGTVAAKNRQGLDPRILHATLSMRRSLTSPTHANHVYWATMDEAFMGSKDPKVKFHQFGTKRNLPRRRPVELTKVHRARWVKILQRHLVEGMS